MPTSPQQQPSPAIHQHHQVRRSVAILVRGCASWQAAGAHPCAGDRVTPAAGRLHAGAHGSEFGPAGGHAGGEHDLATGDAGPLYA
eukprot:7344044-Lingulodinium_polyedra.AAC.1